LIKENQEPWFVSNFSVLLVYSPDKQDEINAIKLAESAFKAEKNIQTLNNLALCYMIAESAGNSKLSHELFKEMAKIVEPDISKTIKNSSSSKEAIQYIDALKKALKNKTEFDEDVSAVILNLALSEINSSKEISNFYLTNFESNSNWAKYLSKSTSIPIQENKNGTSILVDGIQLGSSIKDVLSLWKEPDRKPKIEDEFEVWYYDKKSVKISMRNGIVEQILLYGEDSPALGGIKIGSEKSIVEKELGKKYKKQNRYLIFERKDKIGLSFDENKVERLLIFD
jgi:hypothetical protein